MGSAAMSVVRGAVFVAAVVAHGALAQDGVNVVLRNVAAGEVLNALAKECYEAGMVAEMPSGSVLDCSAVLEERTTGGARRGPNDSNAASDTVVVSHKIRFTLFERGGETNVAADAWTEVAELGIAVTEPIASADYLARVRDTVVAVGERLRTSGSAAPPWQGRYESEQAWHVDAHLRAVRHCDSQLDGMRAEALGEQLESVGIRPLADGTRDRCEQLYQHLFEWGLARGNTSPTVEAYAQYRAALPPAQRICTGRLALDHTCP